MINKNKVCVGWAESDLLNHHESLNKFAMKLKTKDRVAFVEWFDECKIYLLHID